MSAADNWRPTATHATLELRASLRAAVRAWFATHPALEVETPALSQACVTDVHLASVAARIGGQPYYLHTSPEFAMKRLLAAGTGDIWQLARVWRDEERGRLHSPEFTLLEWYRVGIDHHALMDEVEALATHLLDVARDKTGAGRIFAAPERLTYAAAMARHADLDPFRADEAALRARLARAGIDVPASVAVADEPADRRDACLDLIMATLVGPELGRGRLTFVHDYPASQAALARTRGPVASRFELYLDGIELANGFHELTRAEEQRARFAADLIARARRGLPPAVIDTRFLAALEAGLPECAGVALGFDRLVLCATGAARLDDVLAFTL